MQEKPKTLTPKLRFPEFKDELGWEDEPFRDLYAFKPTNTLSRDKLNYQGGTIRNIHYGDIHTRFSTLFDITRELVPFVTDGSEDDYDDKAFCAEGDVVFADASEDLNDVGKNIEIVNLQGERVVSGTHTILATRRAAQLIVGFGGYLFRSERMRQQIRKESQGAKVYGLSSGRLENVKVCFPAKKDEQRKIAACLTSLDEWIAAEGRKLEALRDHKEGLMQQLFPREGETRPRLRFPEFLDAPAWEEWPLARVAENLDYRRVPITEKDRTKGEIPYYGASGVVDYVKGYIFDEDLLCISEDGANLVTRTYPIAFSISGKTWVNNHAHVLRFNDSARQTLVEAYLNATDLRDFITGMAQPKLNRGMLDTIPIPLPPTSAEQQRIAACLSSLDALIVAQSRKLHGLRAHRKALMQQLFPSPVGG